MICLVVPGAALGLAAVHHSRPGDHHHEGPLTEHWVSGAAFALPIAFALALFAIRGLAERWERGDMLGVASRLALGSAVAVGLTTTADGSAFPAPSDIRPLTLAADTAMALPAALVLSAVAVWLASAPVARRLVPQLAMAAMAAVVAATSGTGASAAGGGVCPTSAPVKTFNVSAINVDIPVNRFGDHDPLGKMYVLDSRIADVRAEEASRAVSLGLRDDAIQPLVIRANQGDCVEIRFTNNAGGTYGVHIDGLAFDASSAGEQIGANPSSAAPNGSSRTYRYYVPQDARLEGARYMRPGPGNRDEVSHGLFGALVVEPPGSTYTNPTTGADQESGWEAMIDPGTGKSFREYVTILHEFGPENYDLLNSAGQKLPLIDPHTEAYRPNTRAINYRSEAFMNRLDFAPTEEAHGYASYTFGDPPTPMPRAYLGDPVKWRLVHGGAEVFHVFHLHGGGDRWRFNPGADSSYDYGATGLDKSPKAQQSTSNRLDSQSIGPGESYNLEIEGGAGGVQQAAGDFLWHCHIAKHYIGGMWSFWRVYDTDQPDLKPLPGRAPLPDPVDSSGLIGKTMPDGTVLTSANLDSWIRPQLPPQGASAGSQDATVWDWTRQGDVYLGEPEQTTPWVNDYRVVPGHPSALAVDQFVGNRPKILFNPANGRPAYPLLRPHLGKRPPFSPNGHSGAPWLGERGDVAGTGVWAGRKDGICPAGAPIRRFNVVAIDIPVRVTRASGGGGVDNQGKLFVLAKDKQAVLSGAKPAQPLALRANIGDCVAVTLTSELSDVNSFSRFSMVNMHIHHVQFDPQASDGVISGMQFEQAVRPYQAEDTSLTQAAAAGATSIQVAPAASAKYKPGIGIAVGLGTDSIEVGTVKTVDSATGVIALEKPLASAHAAGQWAGVEFTQYRWYPDVELDNVFWHDHTDGIHGWGQGLVGQLIVEPKGSTYHDPSTGAEVDSGTIVDIRTPNALAPGVVEGSFRELALWTIDENGVTDSTLNLRAEPWATRLAANGDPSLLFSSYTHGDPFTPLPRAYPGDPLVIRTINVSDGVDSIHVDGRFQREGRAGDSSPADTVTYGVSERYSLILKGGPSGPMARPGDFLYMNGAGRRFRQGAWGLIRVLPGATPTLQPLPGNPAPAAQPLPAQTGGRPPEAAGPGNPCPAGANVRRFDVAAVDVPAATFGGSVTAAFVPLAQAASVEAGTTAPEPIVLHVAQSECVEVTLTNHRAVRASFHVSGLSSTTGSSGVNIGFSPEQTVAPGGSRLYRYYADSWKIGAATVSDFGGTPVVPTPTGSVPVNVDTGPLGMYGAVVVGPANATFTDPVTGAPKDIGSQVDVHAGGQAFRDFTVIMSDRDPRIGQNTMPYPTQVSGPALINYRSAPLAGDTGAAFARTTPTPMLRAYAGDPVRVHALVAPGSEQPHVFSLGGMSWAADPALGMSNLWQNVNLAAWDEIDAHLLGGAGGPGGFVGDLFYGDMRRPFTQAGMWGIQRVLPNDGTAGCPIRALTGTACGAPPAAPAITRSPASPSSAASPAYEFTGPAGSTFECSLSAGADTFAACASPVTFGTQPDGTYTFKVRAIDDATGNTSPPAQSTLVIDTVAPTVSVTGSPASPTSTVTPAFEFDAEEGATATCALTAAGAADIFGACTSPVTFPAQPDGSYTFTVRATDAAGNTGQATAALTIDTAGPGVQLDSAPADPTNTPTPAFTFSSPEPGAAFECSIANGGGTSFTACTSPLTYPAMKDGRYTFTVRSLDQAGNASTAAATFTIDTAGPAVTIATRPADPTNEAAPAFSFSSEPGATFACSLSTGAASFQPCSSPVTFPAQPENTYTFRVRATDTAGNTGPVASQTFTIDTTPPSAILTKAPSNPTADTKPAFGFIADETGSTFRCSLEPVGAPDHYTSCTSPDAPGSALADGAYAFKVRATDIAGNEGPPLVYSFTVDTGVFAVSITSAPPARSNNAAPAYAFSATRPGSAFSCSLAPAGSPAQFTPCTSPAAFSLIADGAYTFTVRATNGAGTSTQSASFELDTRAPAVQITGGPNGATPDRTPNFAFASDEAVSGYECSMAAGSAADAYAPCASPLEYAPARPDGPYTFKVRAVDLAGNVSTPVARSIVVDTAAPTAAITARPSNPTNAGTLSFGLGVTGGPATVTCSLSTGAPVLVPCTSPVAYSAQPDGLYTFTVVATDAAGNASAPAAYSFRLDRTAPVPAAPLATPSLNAAMTANVPTVISWSAADGGAGVASYTVEESANGGATFTPIPLPAPTATSATRQLAPGKTYQYRVRSTDKAGNISTFAVGEKFLVGLAQETAASVAYTGTWSTQALAAASGGSMRYASAAGRVARFSFSGIRAAWIAARGPNRGKADVYVDGVKVATVDLWASAQQLKRIVYVASVPAGSHVLEVRVLGTRRAGATGARVDVDAFTSHT
jgi:manganese oxidase